MSTTTKTLEFEYTLAPTFAPIVTKATYQDLRDGAKIIVWYPKACTIRERNDNDDSIAITISNYMCPISLSNDMFNNLRDKPVVIGGLYCVRTMDGWYALTDTYHRKFHEIVVSINTDGFVELTAVTKGHSVDVRTDGFPRKMVDLPCDFDMELRPEWFQKLCNMESITQKGVYCVYTDSFTKHMYLVHIMTILEPVTVGWTKKQCSHGKGLSAFANESSDTERLPCVGMNYKRRVMSNVFDMSSMDRNDIDLLTKLFSAFYMIGVAVYLRKTANYERGLYEYSIAYDGEVFVIATSSVDGEYDSITVDALTIAALIDRIAAIENQLKK